MSRRPAIARGARTNVALMALLALAFLTGWLAFALATAPARWSLLVHAVGGFAILALLPWKSIIARRGLDRPRPGRWASVLFGILVLTSLVAGLLHSSGVLVYWGPLTAMEFHVGAAIAAVPLAVWHVLARRIRLRTVDLSRRNVLRGGVLLAASVTAYAGTEILVRATGMPGAVRRFTGSYEARPVSSGQMPGRSWMFGALPPIAPRPPALTPGRPAGAFAELFSFD